MTQDTTSAALLSLLQQYWQVKSFRALQKEAVLATVDKQDTILILPTGIAAICTALQAFPETGGAGAKQQSCNFCMAPDILQVGANP